MENLRFYPCLTDELLDKCGCNAGKYRFVYYANEIESGLMQKGTNTVKLSDPLELWKLSEDGITLKRTVSIAYPEFLYGQGGLLAKMQISEFVSYGQIIVLLKQDIFYRRVISLIKPEELVILNIHLVPVKLMVT